MNYRKPGRKRYFSSNLNAKKNRNMFLQPGMKGFLCTCNGNEKACIREAYNILFEYADELYGSDSAADTAGPKNADNPTADADDVLDEFKKEVESLKAEKANKLQRFQAVDCGILNCIFIKTTLDNPVHLMQTVMKDMSEKKELKSRFLLRIVPIEIICKANMEDLEKAASCLFDIHFKSDPTTYAIACTKRCNSSLSRDTLIDKLASMVGERNSEHKVNLNNPAVAIVVELMKSNCGLAVIKNYYQMSKYNLRQVCGLPADYQPKSDATKDGCHESKTEEATIAGDARGQVEGVLADFQDEGDASEVESECAKKVDCDEPEKHSK